MTAIARRIRFNALPSVIPIFPLEGALLLPRSRLPLNIFEPRYLAMIDDALKTEHRLIGMIQPRHEDDPTKLYAIGCAGRITSFSETEDGRYLIALAGALRFRVVEELSGFSPYRRVQADWRDFERDLNAPDPPPMSDDDRTTFLELLKRYFAAASLSADWSALTNADRETLTNAIAMLCPFSPQEKQALLESPTLDDREDNLKALMRFVVADPDSSADLQ